MTPRTTWCWWTSPDDLRQRLNEGKVYIGGQAERAIENFFRKGNLIALRELALRRTADRVDEQMRAWRDRQGQEKVWHTRDAILLCIGHNTGSEKLVRAAARLAARLGSASGMRCMSRPLPCTGYRKAGGGLFAALRLAQELGAETATLSDPSEEKAVLHYAREHNLGKIVIGRQRKRRWWDRSGFADRLARHAPDLDLVVIALDDKPSPLPARGKRQPYGAGEMAPAAAGLRGGGGAMRHHYPGGHAVVDGLEAANLVMLYLLGVVLIALVLWPLAVGAGDGDQRHQLRSLFCRPARDAGGVGCPVSAHLRRDAHRGPAYR